MNKKTLKKYYTTEANRALRAKDWDRAADYAAKARALDEPEREALPGQASFLGGPDPEDWEVESPMQRGLFD